MVYGESKAIPRRSGGWPDAWMSDSELLERFNTHHEEAAEAAFAVLVSRHGPMILRVCRQVLGDWSNAEDALQATFLVLARRSCSIRRQELLANWLYGVALRTAREVKMREAHRQRREFALASRPDDDPAMSEEGPDRVLIRREEYEVLHLEVSRLPERYRVPVILCELEGLTYQEAARRLRCPVGTVGVRLSRARKRLTEYLEEGCHVP
jgi:RNA polymerase sigma factor (sigma-70 family)